jgi:predicted enzyme related to lactoylglutathione lyase
MDVSADLATGWSKPSATYGRTIYLGSMGDIDGRLARTVEAGGKVLQEKQLMDMVGWVAFIEDSEGSRIGLHQPE